MKAALFWIASVATLVIIAPGSASAQAWTRPQGNGYVNLSVTALSGDQVYSPNFERNDITPYQQIALGLYGEVGIIDRWLTMTLSSQIFRRNELEDRGATQGLGDTRVGLWSGIVTEPLRISAGLIAGLPTGDSRPSASPGADERAQLVAESLPTGDGEFDLEPRVAAGYSFGGGDWPLAHYEIAELGYQVRTRGFNDAISWKLELGTRVPVEVLDRFLLITRIFGLESFASAEEAAEGFVGLGNGVTYTALSLELYGRIFRGFGASIAADTAFRARGIVAGIPIKFAASYEF